MLMYWLVWRDLTIITRVRAGWIAVAAQTLLLSAVITLWGDGIPVLTGTGLEQLARIHFALSLPLLPWLAARCSPGGGGQFALLAAITASSPLVVVCARVISLILILSMALVTTLPLYVIAVRMTDGTVGESWIGLANLIALVVFASVAVTMSIARGRSRVAAWLETTALAAAVFALVASPSVGPILLLLAGLAGVAGGLSAERQLGALRIMPPLSGEPV
jgi:hypothetical protein